MCGRFVITSPPAAVREVFGYPEQPNFPPRYNIAPTQPIPVVIVENGVRLKSGKTLPAGIIVTATGLTLEAMGGAKASVDGRAVNLGDTFAYRGFACSRLPNLAFVFGYTNSSWTLRADLISSPVIRGG